MRYAASFIAAYLLLATTPTFAQGSSCSNAIPLTMDGVARIYNVSSVAGSPVYCTASGFNGTNGRVTFFQFTTNSTSQCVSIEIATSSAVTLEATLYDGCNAGSPTPSGGIIYHNMCMLTGTGIWAPDLSNNLAPNTTYYLRLRTANNFTGTIQLLAKYNTPANDDCLGATPISTIPVADNNACHTPGPNLTASDLCATTLENTAWYTYVVQNNGSTTITISSIECNNGDGNNNSGFQIGFFTGNCNGLVPLSCNSGVGGSVQATANGLTAGTRLYVAIDGYSGSNCKYTVAASNAQSLPAYIKNFTANKLASANILKWITLQEFQNDYFEIQRATDAINFSALGRVRGLLESNSEKAYQFEDNNPSYKTYYRLKQVDIDGRFKYSNILEVNREKKPEVTIKNINALNGQVKFSIESDLKTEVVYSVIDLSGNIIRQEKISLTKGTNNFYKNMASLAVGKYILILSNSDTRSTQSFYNARNTPW
jgi:hypothetical protein